MAGILEALLPYTPYLALILRVWLGTNFIIHARPKLGKGMIQTMQWTKGMGIPVGAAYTAVDDRLAQTVPTGLVRPSTQLKTIAVSSLAPALRRRVQP